VLLQRNDINPAEEAILDQFEAVRNQVLVSQNLADQAKYQAETLWLNLESYRNTGKDELESRKADLKTLLDDPQAGIDSIRARLPALTVIRWCSSCGKTWMKKDESTSTQRRPNPQATTMLQISLRNTGKEELNPEGIQRDLTGCLKTRKREPMRCDVDRSGRRDTLVKLLSQRQDLSEEASIR